MLALGAISAGAGPRDVHRSQPPPAIANTAATAAIGMTAFIPRDGTGGRAGEAGGAEDGAAIRAIERARGGDTPRAFPPTRSSPVGDIGEVAVAPRAEAGFTRTVASSSIGGGIPASS